MKPINPGPPLPVRELSSQERAEIGAELAALEADLARWRSKYRYWALRKHQAETEPDIPQDLRESAFHFFAQAERLVTKGERVRSYLLLQLRDQPEYAPAYHYTH